MNLKEALGENQKKKIKIKNFTEPSRVSEYQRRSIQRQIDTTLQKWRQQDPCGKPY
jgi:hypothetical protein